MILMSMMQQSCLSIGSTTPVTLPDFFHLLGQLRLVRMHTLQLLQEKQLIVSNISPDILQCLVISFVYLFLE